MSFLLKYWFNIENIYQTIQPVCRCMKWFGFLPFTLLLEAPRQRTQQRMPTAAAPSGTGDPPPPAPLPPPARLVVKLTDLLPLLVWLGYIVSMCFSEWFSLVLDAPMSKIMIFFNVLIFIIVMITISASLILTAFSKAKIEEVLRLVKFTDETLAKFSIPINHRREHMCLVLLMLGAALGAGVVMAAELFLAVIFHERISTWKKFFTIESTVFFYASRLIELCPLVLFLAAMFAFRARFRLLNGLIHKKFVDPESDNVEMDENSPLMLIAICHDALTEAVNLFCDVFSFQVVFGCTSYIIFAIFNCYSIGAFFSRRSIDVLFLSLFYTLGNLQFTAHILPIIKLASDVQSEGKRTAVLVHKAINQSLLPAAAIDRLLLFSRQLQQQSPIVSSGMFAFDWTLCFSLLSTTATYTMIMVQFEMEVPKFFIDALVSGTTGAVEQYRTYDNGSLAEHWCCGNSTNLEGLT